ncbi:MAG: DUF2267 domain-containing protein [Proteobacteria bacterium]|nr:DUF2267 domain-containing protein [Pseudomonadota bacterium]
MMSTGLAVFDTTVQESNAWLKDIEIWLPPCDRRQAYAALRAVLHALRDRLPLDAVQGLSAQLPMLLRGVFYEGWGPSEPAGHDLGAFAEEVAARLPPGFPRTPQDVVEAVFAAMGAHLDPGEVRKIVTFLPKPLRSAWPFEHRIS